MKWFVQKKKLQRKTYKSQRSCLNLKRMPFAKKRKTYKDEFRIQTRVELNNKAKRVKQ